MRFDVPHSQEKRVRDREQPAHTLIEACDRNALRERERGVGRRREVRYEFPHLDEVVRSVWMLRLDLVVELRRGGLRQVSGAGADLDRLYRGGLYPG